MHTVSIRSIRTLGGPATAQAIVHDPATLADDVWAAYVHGDGNADTCSRCGCICLADDATIDEGTGETTACPVCRSDDIDWIESVAYAVVDASSLPDRPEDQHHRTSNAAEILRLCTDTEDQYRDRLLVALLLANHDAYISWTPCVVCGNHTDHRCTEHLHPACPDCCAGPPRRTA